MGYTLKNQGRLHTKQYMKNQSLLIIDDEPLSLTLLSDYLKDSGYQIILADSGEKALEFLAQPTFRFSAIILDRMLPDIDGITLLQTIKNHSALRSIPVIMLSSDADKNEKIAAFKNGIYDFLLKPIDSDLLNLVLKRAVRDSHNLVVC